jgi:hypothetical protein
MHLNAGTPIVTVHAVVCVVVPFLFLRACGFSDAMHLILEFSVVHCVRYLCYCITLVHFFHDSIVVCNNMCGRVWISDDFI